MEDQNLLGLDGAPVPGRHKGGGGSRAAILQFLSVIPNGTAIAQDLKDKKLQVSDKTIHVTNIPIAGLTSVKVFNDDNGQVVTKGNISKGKLETGVHMAVTSIRVLYTVPTSSGVGSTAADTDYTGPTALIRNGEWTLRLNGAEAITKASMECFQAVGNANREAGTYYLENAKLILAEQPIEFNIEWQAAAPAGAMLKVLFFGSTITKA